MTSPPPAVLAVLAAQRDALKDVAPARRQQLMDIAAGVQRDLERRLQALSGSPDRYSTQEVRVLLAQVREVVDTLGAEFGVGIGGALEELGREAAGIGRTTLLAEIDAWADEFKGSVRRIAPVDLAGDLLGDGLLEYYDVSRDTYGMDAIRQMRQQLATSTLSGDSVAVAAQKLAAKVELPEWKAERIVREFMDRIPTIIYRPTIVVGDSVSGEIEKIDGPYYGFVMISRNLHVAMQKSGKTKCHHSGI